MLMPRHQLLCIRIIAVFFVYLLSFATLSAQEVRIVLSGTELPAREPLHPDRAADRIQVCL